MMKIASTLLALLLTPLRARLRTPLFASLFAPLLVLQLQAAPPGAPPAGPRFSAKLLAASESVQPGGQTELLLEIDVPQPWHIYHPIVIDTGLPTDVRFETPPGVTIGELRFPAPTLGETAGFEYLELSGKVGCIAPLAVAADVSPGQTLAIKANVSGLACTDKCLPVSAKAMLELPVTETQGKPANQERFKEAREALAPRLGDAPYLKGSSLRVSKDRLGIDEPAELIATIRVQRGNHIWDRQPGIEGLIPSRLFIEKIPGLEFAEEAKQVWPEPHVRDMPGLGKVREHTGRFEIRVPFRIVDQLFPSGPVTVRVLFSYQSCNEAGTCFPPEMATGLVRFEAVTPNAQGEEPVAAADVGSDQRPAVVQTYEATWSRDETAAGIAEAGSAAVVVRHLTAEDWAEHIPWQTWRPGLAEELSRQGHRVYVDYTATWCLTCQTNKKLVLETDAIRNKMRDLGVIPIKADFTSKDPVMLEEIKKHGHNTVPLNLVYAPGRPDSPGRLPALLTKEVVEEALENPLAFADGGVRQRLLAILLAGFLGGLILNVMPCVLPVISIKILSFVQQAGEDPKRVLRLGLAFCAGIMVWFWAFAILSAQGNIPWQYPEVVVALGAIIFVFSLNLFGVFEIVLPGTAAGKLDAVASREGYLGAFLKGVLATLLGTACTAPFLATALGYALTQPWWVGFAIFTAAGIGMSLPYLILSAKPAWLKFLPKPGNWMVTFKQASGFVLLATAVWLLWILAAELDGLGVVWTVAFWGFLGLAAWMVGRIKLTWRPGSRAAMWTASVAVVLFGLYFCYVFMYDWSRGKSAAAGGEGTAQAAAMLLDSGEDAGPASGIVRKER